LQLEAAGADQVIADVPAARVVGGGRAGLVDGAPGHVDLADVRAAGQALDDLAVQVAGGEVLLLVDAGGVLAQEGLDPAETLDEGAPVQGGQQAQAGDAVADTHLAGGLALALATNDLVNIRATLEQVLLQPARARLA